MSKFDRDLYPQLDEPDDYDEYTRPTEITPDTETSFDRRDIGEQEQESAEEADLKPTEDFGSEKNEPGSEIHIG